MLWQVEKSSVAVQTTNCYLERLVIVDNAKF